MGHQHYVISNITEALHQESKALITCPFIVRWIGCNVNRRYRSDPFYSNQWWYQKYVAYPITRIWLIRERWKFVEIKLLRTWQIFARATRVVIFFSVPIAVAIVSISLIYCRYEKHSSYSGRGLMIRSRSRTVLKLIYFPPLHLNILLFIRACEIGFGFTLIGK